MLQVADRGLLLEALQPCGTTIQRSAVARLAWPKYHNGNDNVLKSPSWMCVPEANEEETLATASPMILVNKQYQSQSLLLTIRNRVHKFDLTTALNQIEKALKSCKDGCSQCVNSKNLTTVPSKGIIVNLAGRSLVDSKASSSTTMVRCISQI